MFVISHDSKLSKYKFILLPPFYCFIVIADFLECLNEGSRLSSITENGTGNALLYVLSSAAEMQERIAQEGGRW